MQGGSVDQSYYSGIAEKIASYGYIVVAPNAPRAVVMGTEVQLTSPHATLMAKNFIQAADVDPTSDFYGHVKFDSFALFGHSFGGVMSIVAGSHDAAFLCSIPLRTLCANYTGFGAGLKAVVTYGTTTVDRARGTVNIINSNTTGVPNILIRGKLDGRVLVGDFNTTYETCLETPKAYIELDGANHFGITDSQTVVGGSNDTSVQTKSQEWSITQIAKIAVTAFDAHLKNDNGAWKKIYTKRDLAGNAATVVKSQWN